MKIPAILLLLQRELCSAALATLCESLSSQESPGGDFPPPPSRRRGHRSRKELIGYS